MAAEVTYTAYGRAAVEVPCTFVANAKKDDPMAPVTVLVPSNIAGIVARRHLAHGLTAEGKGVAGIWFTTLPRLAEQVAPPTLTGQGRRPATRPRQRIPGAKYPMHLLADSDQGKTKEAEVSCGPRVSGASTNDSRHGFVSDRVQHTTLKSIASNPLIVEGMTRDQIVSPIKKHADFETLYDRPSENKHLVRAAGEQQPDAPQFEASSLENLAKAGIQNGLKGERIELESIEPEASTYLQAVATQKVKDGDSGGGDDGIPLRIGIALGPQYGPRRPRLRRERSQGSRRRQRHRPALRPGVRIRRTRCRSDRGPRGDGRDVSSRVRPGRPGARLRADQDAASSDERRPPHGRGPEEDWRRQPVHRLR